MFFKFWFRGSVQGISWAYETSRELRTAHAHFSCGKFNLVLAKLGKNCHSLTVDIFFTKVTFLC